MTIKTLLTFLVVAVVFSLATAFYYGDEDLDLESLEEMQKRNGYEDALQMDRRALPRGGFGRKPLQRSCRHWLTGAKCHCDIRYPDETDQRRYVDCLPSRSRGYKGKPFG